MDKQQLKQLLIQVKVFFPRFDAVEKDGNKYGVMSQTIDAWYRQIGYLEYDRALEILDQYMASDNGSKTPNISLWVQNGRVQSKAWHSAILDRRHGVIRWQPEDGLPQELPCSFDTNRGVWVDTVYGYDWYIPEVEVE